MKVGYLLFISIALMASMCDHKSDPSQKPDRSTLKIVLVDSIGIYNEDDERHLPESIRSLCAVLISNNKDCSQTYILDPSLVRLDHNAELSLKTNIEKGGSKDVSNPKVIGRLIQKNFDEIDVPKYFAAKKAVTTDVNGLLTEFAVTKSANDSILVFSENGPEKYILNNKTYKSFATIDDVRNRMLTILCENDKANFTVLISPPVVSSGDKVVNNGGTTASSTGHTQVVETSHKSKERTTKSFKVKRINPNITGDLTIIKGSEGCDVCMHYYTATDNLGRRHEVREKNSTFCCPCDKTVEIKGRTYRMDCDGPGSNRLALVE